MVRRIIFIYNADSGLLSALWDSARKAVDSPEACDLCTITHGLLAERGDWKRIDQELGLPTHYYHRDEIPPAIQGFLDGSGVALPAVLLEGADGSYELVASAEALRECRGDPNCLQEKLERVLARRR
jgi:hypothetical protein